MGFSTLDHVAHILSYTEYKNTCHHHETLEDYKKTLTHEFIHELHDLFCGGRYNGIKAIWEGVAVYLSEQYECNNEDLNLNKEALPSRNSHIREYSIFFKKLINTYDHKTILEILKNKINGNQILEEITR